MKPASRPFEESISLHHPAFLVTNDNATAVEISDDPALQIVALRAPQRGVCALCYLGLN